MIPVTSWWSHLADIFGYSIAALVCFFVDFWNSKPILLANQLRDADKCLVNIMKVYIERNNSKLEYDTV